MKVSIQSRSEIAGCRGPRGWIPEEADLLQIGFFYSDSSELRWCGSKAETS